MIERINKPEAPVPHRVEQAKQTKEDRHQQQNPKDDAEREQRKQIEGGDWEKFGRQNAVIKQLRVPRDRIARCLYRAVTLHSGIGTLMVDVIWRDRKITRGALMLVTRLEDFIRLKKLTLGKDVPEELWAKGPTVELGIMQRSGGAIPGKDIGGKREADAVAAPEKPGALQRIGIMDREGKPNWGLALLYLFLLTLAVMAVIILIL